MAKIIKQGRVVVVTNGRFAGQKAFILSSTESSTKNCFDTVTVCGISKPPKKVTRGMSQAKQAKKSRVQCFVKTLNVAHIMPTRFNIPMETFDPVEMSRGLSYKKASERRIISKYFASKLTDKYQQRDDDQMQFLCKKMYV